MQHRCVEIKFAEIRAHNPVGSAGSPHIYHTTGGKTSAVIPIPETVAEVA
jgi:hypothetical protein